MASRRTHDDYQIDCATCQAQLAEYVTRELNNEPVDQRFPALTFHIETCAACQSLYFARFRSQGLRKTLPELQQIGRHTAVSATLAEITQRSAASVDRALHANWVKDAFDFGYVWLDTEKKRWQQLQIALHQLLIGPTDTAGLALAGLQSMATVEPGATASTAQVDYADGDLLVQLAVETTPVAAETDARQLVVTISTAEQWDRLPEFQVTLHYEQSDLTGQPDEFGTITFTPVPRNILAIGTLTIRPPR
ncbi:MAG: hypothetical protein KDE47_24970 [Caldilineaceae bacterium]|nr:hypothetical protein [Caldilineaceae bacterium]